MELHLVYVSFKDESLTSMTTLPLSSLHMAELGPLSAAEVKELGLHAKAKVAKSSSDSGKNAARSHVPVVRLCFKVSSV